jgi:hypothetical protein
LKVTFDLSDDSRLTQLQYQCHSQSVEIFVLSFSTHGAISALAENSASFFGLDRAESRRGGRIEEAHHTGLREKFGNGSRIELRPELNGDYEVEN